MLNTLFLISLLATLFMAWRSYKQWGAYNRAAVTRTAMVSQVTLTSGLAALTVLLLVVKSFVRF